MAKCKQQPLFDIKRSLCSKAIQIVQQTPNRTKKGPGKHPNNIIKLIIENFIGSHLHDNGARRSIENEVPVAMQVYNKYNQPSQPKKLKGACMCRQSIHFQ